jgi:hypothetical protein
LSSSRAAAGAAQPDRIPAQLFILICGFRRRILIYLVSLQKIDKASTRRRRSTARQPGRPSGRSFCVVGDDDRHRGGHTVITLSHFSENKVIQYVYSHTYAVGSGIGYASAMAFLYFLALLLLLALVYWLLTRTRSESR